MKKKVVIGVSIVVLFVLVCLGIYFMTKKDNDEDVTKNNEEEKIAGVVSSVTLDINPSLRLDLDENEKVINVIPLNSDANDVIPRDFKNKDLKEVIGDIAGNLIQKGYASDELVILLSTEGEIKEEDVKNILDNSLNEKQVSHNVLIIKVSESSKEIAEKYNITLSKATYLENVIKAYPDLKVEDIKDKSIKEIDETTREIEEQKQTEQNNSEAPSESYDEPRYGTMSDCERLVEGVSRENAALIAINNKGANYNPNGYCDVRYYESYASKSPEGVCAYQVTFTYNLERCVYFINYENGSIVGSPTCTHVEAGMGDIQCAIMRELGVSRENVVFISDIDMGSEFVSTVIYNGYTYEYHVSKYSGQITNKILLEEPTPDSIYEEPIIDGE